MLKNKKGFSLIELLAVVMCIGILATIAIPNYRSSVLKTKIASNMPLMRALQSDMLNFYDRTSHLPTSLNQLAINSSEFNNQGVHISTGCTITVDDTINNPNVSMDCHQGWNMVYSLQPTSYGYSLGPKTFNITATGDEQARLQKVANNFGWSGSGNTYTIQ